MKTSNLAERLEEFAATVERLGASEQRASCRPTAAPDAPQRMPRRLTLDTRRIRIRDSGLRSFRVF
jgi:hypothetical protein